MSKTNSELHSEIDHLERQLEMIEEEKEDPTYVQSDEEVSDEEMSEDELSETSTEASSEDYRQNKVMNLSLKCKELELELKYERINNEYSRQLLNYKLRIFKTYRFMYYTSMVANFIFIWLYTFHPPFSLLENTSSNQCYHKSNNH